jgi:hypothetical protein
MNQNKICYCTNAGCVNRGMLFILLDHEYEDTRCRICGSYTVEFKSLMVTIF